MCKMMLILAIRVIAKFKRRDYGKGICINGVRGRGDLGLNFEEFPLTDINYNAHLTQCM
uniref:Uncharacterized protein n=1 Tax=Rhizophora mucronata TaxID=61149 RepID=A0A2P2NXA8_RHIMU